MMTLFALVVMAVYLSAIVRCYGVQQSVSATYYCLPGSMPMLFTLLMWLQAFSLLPVMMEASADRTAATALAFLAMGGVVFVGATPNVIDKEESKVHTAGAYVSAVASQLWVLLVRPCFLLMWILAAVAFVADRKHLKWWLEIICMLIVYTTIIYGNAAQ